MQPEYRFDVDVLCVGQASFDLTMTVSHHRDRMRSVQRQAWLRVEEVQRPMLRLLLPDSAANQLLRDTWGKIFTVSGTLMS